MRQPYIICAKYPGTAIDGSRIRRTDLVLWDPVSRRVLTANPSRIEQWRLDSAAAAHDERHLAAERDRVGY